MMYTNDQCCFLRFSLLITKTKKCQKPQRNPPKDAACYLYNHKQHSNKLETVNQSHEYSLDEYYVKRERCNRCTHCNLYSPPYLRKNTQCKECHCPAIAHIQIKEKLQISSELNEMLSDSDLSQDHIVFYNIIVVVSENCMDKLQIEIQSTKIKVNASRDRRNGISSIKPKRISAH